MSDNLKREIEINRIIGEMAGSIKGVLFLYKEHMNKNQISSLEDLLKRYEEFFKVDSLTEKSQKKKRG